jgi:lysozyme
MAALGRLVTADLKSLERPREEFMPINTIIDIYHNTQIDFAKVKAAGILAIIHKATEGGSVRDEEYSARRQIAKDMGFLWGAYHYASGTSVTDQVQNFLEYASPIDSDFIALDFEASTSGPNMTLDQAHRFVETIKTETGRYPLIYGGSMLREAVGTDADSILANCPLWYSRYRDTPIGIPGQVWSKYTLWQYTDGNSGPEPKAVDGIGRCDRSIFNGSTQDLKAQWPFTRK